VHIPDGTNNIVRHNIKLQNNSRSKLEIYNTNKSEYIKDKSLRAKLKFRGFFQTFRRGSNGLLETEELCGLWAGRPVNGPLWPGWPSRPMHHRINEGGVVRVSPNPQPPFCCWCMRACWRRQWGRRWPSSRPAVVRGGGFAGPGGAPLLLFSPSSVFVRHPRVRRRVPPAAGRWPAFRGRRWGAPARPSSRCRAGSPGGGRQPRRDRRGSVQLRPHPRTPVSRKRMVVRRRRRRTAGHHPVVPF
jgi:hypothetical protein